MKTSLAAIFGLIVLIGPQPASAMPNDSDQVNLGTVWSETELGWQGTWQRVGQSNQFRAVWTKQQNPVVRADLTMTVNGNTVSIVRRDTAGSGVGKGCRYSGTIQGAAVAGKYSCDWGKGSMDWRATISGQ